MRRRGYHHGDLRAALLEAVAVVIREHGVGHVSLREVARRAGVSHAAPAHHFRSKAGLLTAFAAQGYGGHFVPEVARRAASARRGSGKMEA